MTFDPRKEAERLRDELNKYVKWALYITQRPVLKDEAVDALAAALSRVRRETIEECVDSVYKLDVLSTFMASLVAAHIRDAMSDEARALAVPPAPQGYCETTMTERFAMKCECPTYAGNLGPCKGFEEGGNSRCVYCDHTSECHKKLTAALAEAEKSVEGEK